MPPSDSHGLRFWPRISYDTWPGLACPQFLVQGTPAPSLVLPARARGQNSRAWTLRPPGLMMPAAGGRRGVCPAKGACEPAQAGALQLPGSSGGPIAARGPPTPTHFPVRKSHCSLCRNTVQA